MLPFVEDVVRRLDAEKGNWRRISEISGVPYDTLTKIAQGKTTNPRVETIANLDDALRQVGRGSTVGIPQQAAWNGRERRQQMS